ncbi:GDP-mannose transporter [Diplonema papillatum]|nr:GDP-mannose transporter [Diplonema papillatum]
MDDDHEKPLCRRMEHVVSMAAYCVCSVSMIILNKLVLDSKGFHFPFVVLFFQNASATAFVVTLRLLGIIEYPGLERSIVRRWLPLIVLFTGMLATSLMALQTMSVPLFTLIKSLAIISTAIGDHFLFGHVFNRVMVFAFFLMSLGSLLGAKNDAWSTQSGVAWAFFNVLCTSGYQLYMKGVLNDLKSTMGKWGPVYYNNILSLPPLLLPVVLSYDEWSNKLEALNDFASICYVICMIFVSATLTMTSFWCMRTTSPTTYGVLGGLNKIPLTVLGIWIFGHYTNVPGAIGIVAALTGGVIYSCAVAAAPKTEGGSTPAAMTGLPSPAVLMGLSPTTITGGINYSPVFGFSLFKKQSHAPTEP